MAQTKAGAAKAKAKLLEKNPNYYIEMAVKGGATPHRRGFDNAEVAKAAGRLGAMNRWQLVS